MNLRELYNLIEMIPEAGMEYISTRLLPPNELSKDEKAMLATWISKKVRADRSQVIKDILLTLNYANIQWISNTNEAEELKAVYHDPYLIQHLEAPTVNVQMAAVKNTSVMPSKIFNLIKDPSSEAWLALIEEDPARIRGMKNPTLEMQLAAITAQPKLITDSTIEWDSETRALAFEKDWRLFPNIVNPTVEQCWEALRNNPAFIKDIPNASVEMKAYTILVA